MAQEDLISLADRTTEEQQAIARMGGKASGVARRKKRNMQEFASILLGMALKNGEVHTIEDIQSLADLKGKNLTVDQAILLKQAEKALKGDLKSAEFIRDTSGQKPIETVKADVTSDNNELKDILNQIKKE